MNKEEAKEEEVKEEETQAASSGLEFGPSPHQEAKGLGVYPICTPREKHLWNTKTFEAAAGEFLIKVISQAFTNRARAPAQPKPLAKNGSKPAITLAKRVQHIGRSLYALLKGVFE